MPGPGEGALVTLHYRIELEDGSEVLSTFGGNPATLALGSSEFAPALERCLAQAEEGKTSIFLLQPGEAFGERREDLVQTMPRAEFPAQMKVEQGVLIEFSGGDGGKHGGLVARAFGRVRRGGGRFQSSAGRAFDRIRSQNSGKTVNAMNVILANPRGFAPVWSVRSRSWRARSTGLRRAWCFRCRGNWCGEGAARLPSRPCDALQRPLESRRMVI